MTRSRLVRLSVAATVVAGVQFAMLAPQARAPLPGRLAGHPAVRYARQAPADAVAVLNAALAAGSRRLRHEARTGYLTSVLDTLGVAPESQLLVFSKTGVQRAHTGPDRPRALYFNESVAVGYIPGAAAIEVASLDRTQGVLFYTLDQRPASAPAFVRQTSCLACHVAASTLDVPGFIARSHIVDGEGRVIPGEPVVAVTHSTPHPQRWGGWFVTSEGAPPPYQVFGHLGNLTATPHPRGGASIVSNHALVEWLATDAVSAGYPSAASDLAALLVFDHQMHAANLLTRLGWEARVAVDQGRDPVRSLATRIDELVDYLLFVGEAAPTVEVQPRAGFQQALLARIPRDPGGRSLAELNLEPRSPLATDLTPPTRLFRYPCSFMIYTPAFDGLPVPVKNAVYARLFGVLGATRDEPRYQHLTPGLREAIRAIVLATKADVPAGLGRPAAVRGPGAPQSRSGGGVGRSSGVSSSANDRGIVAGE